MSDVDDAVSELISVLTSLVPFLREFGEQRWVVWIEKSNRRLRDGDLYGAEYLLRAYGGMGSLTDVVVPQAQSAIFATLRNRAWELARFIQRNSN